MYAYNIIWYVYANVHISYNVYIYRYTIYTSDIGPYMAVSVSFSDEMILPETSYILTPMIYKMGWAIQQGPTIMVDEKTRHDST